MNDPSVTTDPPASEPEREEKPVAQLERGTWVELIDQDGENFGEAEVLHVEPYADGALSMLMYRMPGSAPDVFRFPADMTVPLLTEVEMAARREAAKRAEKIADIRAYIAWLEANPNEPVGYAMGGQVDAPGDPAEAVARVRALAAQHGGEVRELEDRTSTYVRFGSVEHRVIAWHKDGRPAEPAPVPADPTGLGYSREADDPTPVSPARGPSHVADAVSHIDGKTGRREDNEIPQPVGERELTGPDEAAPGDCTCWATSLNGCPIHYLSEAR